ncbi:MAG TPA: hypothetical protein VFT04_08325 [Gemmatimonadales bacterium]|nr:hypothetical protein [Gemmatimonadales bacterium]
MNRILRGAVVLAASALFAGCNTEPDETQGGDPTDIVVNPASVFIDRGDSNAVLIRLVDQQGTSLNSPISITAVSPGLSIFVDSMFRPTFNPDGTLQAETRNTELRIFVRGNNLEAGSFTVTAGGLTEEVPVTVTPTEITPAVSSVTPAIGEVVTITPEAGLTFSQTSTVVDAAGALAALTLSVAPDGSSMSVQFVEGFSGTPTITGIVPSYAPTLAVELPSTVDVTVGATVGVDFAGVDDPSTAPVLHPATSDRHVGIIDNGLAMPAVTPNTDGSRLYKLIVEEGAEYTVELTWAGGKDLGVWVWDETFTTVIGSDDAGGLNDGTETAHVELDPGTYFIEAGYFDYGAPTLPEYIRIDVFVE